MLQARLDAPWQMDRDPQLGLGPDLGVLFSSQPLHLLLRATQRWETTGMLEQQFQMRATAHLSRQSSLRLSWVQAGRQGQTLPELWLGWQRFFP